MPRARILLVEDDINLGFVIKDNLEISDYEVALFTNGEEGWNAFNKSVYDLCILDIMLPVKDGVTLAEDIRKKDDAIPILFLTAKGMKEDRLKGFKAGGDDYITKPFSIEELIMRIEVFLKRSQKVFTENKVFYLGSCLFDYSNLSITKESQSIILTQKEADILYFFCLNKEVVLKRDEILKKVWGNDDYFTGRSLDVFITKLRKYLSMDEAVEIQNIHGVGFKLTIRKTA